jgi:hypothetical protein
MFQPLERALVLPAMATLALAIPPATAGAAAAPKVKAKPHNVMVGAETTLTGRHFPAEATITLGECGRTFWMAPSDPCLPEHDVTVKTDSKGRFQTPFTVGLCPEGEATKRPTQRICFVGELVTGEDTGELVGAAKLVVTFP